jgi:hypothetical protein
VPSRKHGHGIRSVSWQPFMQNDSLKGFQFCKPLKLEYCLLLRFHTLGNGNSKWLLGGPHVKGARRGRTYYLVKMWQTNLPESVSHNWIGLDTCSAGKKKTFLNKVNSDIYYSKNYALDFSKITVLQIIIYLYYVKLSSYYFSLLYCKQVR